MAVGRGQQDPAKHQLLAAFYTGIRRAGHIYATASSRALIAWIIRLPPAVFFCLFAPTTTPPRRGRVGAAYLLLFPDGEKRPLTVPDGCITQLAYSAPSLSADRAGSPPSVAFLSVLLPQI